VDLRARIYDAPTLQNPLDMRAAVGKTAVAFLARPFRTHSSIRAPTAGVLAVAASTASPFGARAGTVIPNSR